MNIYSNTSKVFQLRGRRFWATNRIQNRIIKSMLTNMYKKFVERASLLLSALVNTNVGDLEHGAIAALGSSIGGARPIYKIDGS